MQALLSKAEPLRVRSVEGGLTPVRREDESHGAWMLRLAEAVGTDDTEIARLTIRSLAAGLGHRDDVTLNALLAQVREMAPQNAVERCLLIQMMLTSHKAMRAMAESGGAMMPEESAAQSALSIRLMRLYLQQCETLRKLKSSGSQTITINHVVADKAVIGDVYQGGGDMKNPETKRRQGGQPGNTNAVKSGRYMAERRAGLSSSIELCRVLHLSLRHIGTRRQD